MELLNEVNCILGKRTCSDNTLTGYETEAESDDDDGIYKRRFRVTIYLPSLLTLELDLPQLSSGRAPNQRRDRTAILEWARALDDKMFRRQFRLQRIDFLYVFGLISGVLKKDEQKAINSSGSSIAPELMLYITLRILAGASYLDMIHYSVIYNVI
jgi:hypothetical protein